MTPASTVLLVDDENAILDMLLISLAPGAWRVGDAAARVPCEVAASEGDLAGTRFLVARSGEQALELASREVAAGRPLSGGFFDLHMPGGMQGQEIMARLRRLQPGLPCTVITGLQGELDSLAAIFAPDHLDEWDFVSKPFTRPEILQRCRQMVTSSERRRREQRHVVEISRLNTELELWARSLETRVQERTEQLARAMESLREKNEELECVLQALHATQAELVQHEKMATIGQLAAGVARELSRPLAFARQALSGAGVAVEKLGGLAASVEAEARARPESSPEAVALRAGFAAICQAARPAAAQAEASSLLENADDALARAGGIVRELSAFASPATREPKPVDVGRTIQCAIDFLRGSLQRGERVEADLPDLPPVLGSDSEFQHAWLQILRNAVEATSGRTGDAVIRVAAHEEDGEVVVEFTDNGEGIPGELRDRIFEPFFSTRGRKAGLGLSVVHGVLARHGGHVEVQAATPCGTVFRVHLPVPATARLRAC